MDHSELESVMSPHRKSHGLNFWGANFLVDSSGCTIRATIYLESLIPQAWYYLISFFRTPGGEVSGKISGLPMKKLRFKEIFLRSAEVADRNPNCS